MLYETRYLYYLFSLFSLMVLSVNFVWFFSCDLELAPGVQCATSFINNQSLLARRKNIKKISMIRYISITLSSCILAHL